jgi:hypothetical protein
MESTYYGYHIHFQETSFLTTGAIVRSKEMDRGTGLELVSSYDIVQNYIGLIAGYSKIKL